jgi:MFS transporter, FHS family, glucose/mannose:H+ symporter
LNKRATAAGFISFALVGALQAVYGPIIPGLRHSFNLDAGTAGWIIGVRGAGAVCGVLLSAALASKVTTRSRLLITNGILILSSALFGLANDWNLVLLAGFGVGLGWGSFALSYNLLFASRFSRHSGAMVMLINAVFGVGSIVGPLLLGLLPIGGYRGLFLAAAGLEVIVFPLAMNVPAALVDYADRDSRSHLRLVAAFITLFFLYGGVEVGIASWAPTHLLADGVTASIATSVTGFFYATYTAGRFLAAPVALKVREQHLVLGGFILILLVMPLATKPALATVAYTVSGLFAAPIFGALLVWLTRLLPGAERISSMGITAGFLGSGMIPVGIGQLINRIGPQVLPLAVGAVSLAALALTACLLLWTRSTETNRPSLLSE